MVDTPNQARAEALAQLKAAQEMIQEGRNELAAANAKIAEAQRLINESANILRGTWGDEKKPSPS